ncbi:crotonase [Artemisia annua]|uniref:Crotonase n=1 Tax=Artemisia annua TaxID=35608 RepID=A0A2U1N0Z4_ARTAN|nr:crotonase [Artemisia annua]
MVETNTSLGETAATSNVEQLANVVQDVSTAEVSTAEEVAKRVDEAEIAKFMDEKRRYKVSEFETEEQVAFILQEKEKKRAHAEKMQAFIDEDEVLQARIAELYKDKTLTDDNKVQRLADLINERGVELALSQRRKKLGLLDAIIPPQELLKVSRQWASDIAEKRRPWVWSLHNIDKIGSLSEAHEIIKFARQKAKLTTPNMPQHVACLDVIDEGILQGGYHCVLKVPNITDIGLKPRVFKKVEVAEPLRAMVMGACKLDNCTTLVMDEVSMEAQVRVLPVDVENADKDASPYVTNNVTTIPTHNTWYDTCSERSRN